MMLSQQEGANTTTFAISVVKAFVICYHFPWAESVSLNDYYATKASAEISDSKYVC